MVAHGQKRRQADYEVWYSYEDDQDYGDSYGDEFYDECTSM